MTHEAHRVADADAQPQPPPDLRRRRIIGRKLRPRRQLGFFRLWNKRASLDQNPLRSRGCAPRADRAITHPPVCARIMAHGAHTEKLNFSNLPGTRLAYR